MYQNKRINILQIPIDIIEDDQMESAVRAILEEDVATQICLIRYKDILKAQFNRETMDCLKNSRLNIPITPAVTFAASFLKREKPSIKNPFTFVIRLMGVLENSGKSIYVLGSRKKNILKSESNLRTSFPGLQIVGRYAGTFTAQEEQDIILAVKKSSPSLLLTGKGLKGNNLWLYRNRKNFNAGISLWGQSCFEIFSGNNKKPSNPTALKLMLKAFLSILLPWRLMGHIFFFLLLTIEKIKDR